MNESISYSEALKIATSPSNVSEAQKLFLEIAPITALNLFVPLIILLGSTMVWTIYRDHKYKKIWNNDDFWLGVLLMVVSMLAIFIATPYLFVALV